MTGLESAKSPPHGKGSLGGETAGLGPRQASSTSAGLHGTGFHETCCRAARAPASRSSDSP